MKLLLLVTIFVCIQSLDCSYNKNKINPRLNFFDVELLRYASEENKGNVMISPASVKSTLAMLMQGAIGQTAFEIQRALRFSPEKEELAKELSLFLNTLKSNTSTVVQNANGIFISRRYRLRRSYEDIVRREYLSEVNSLDFADGKSAANAINNWVSQKTHGLIPFLVDPGHIQPTTQLLVANALYFKSRWHNAFDPRLTRSGCFYKEDFCHNVAMMDLSAELNYAFVDELRAHSLELPYENKRYSMILLVPLDRDGCSDVIRDLPHMSLQHIEALMRPTDIQLLMPKFNVNYNQDLVKTLTNMRITSLFTSYANLSGIIEGDSGRVNSFHHKVFMSVDESGTVAAAATSAMVVPLIYSGVDIRVDRPFVFFIKDNEAGVVLFEGRIEEPTAFEGPPAGTPVLRGQPPLGYDPNIDLRITPPNYSTPQQKESGGFVNSLKKLFG